MNMLHSLCCILVSQLVIVHALGDDSNYIRYLTTVWNGKEFVPEGDTEPPFTFSLSSKEEKNVIVNFTGRSLTDNEDNFYTPSVFGIMFKGDNNSHLHIQVQNTGSSIVSIYQGFEKLLQPQEPLQVIFDSRHSNLTWNGTIEVPVDYFPRATNQLAAYANFTKAPNHIVVLSLVHLSNNKTLEPNPPNLHKQQYFTDIRMQTYLPKVNFDHWSPMWQQLLQVLPGGTNIHPDAVEPHNHHNVGSINHISVYVMFAAAFAILLKH